jgi:hypothetical protein
MIREIVRGAHALDAWLRERFGRPYVALLTVGLVLGIIESVKNLIHTAETTPDVVKVALAIAFQLALLINQLAQFHQYREERRARKAARGG